jgi:osmotically-inducible protein OsmY
MKTTIRILIVMAVLVVLGGCVSYVTPATYQESTAYVKDYEILGFFSVELPVKQPAKDVQGVKEMAMEAALREYPDADDIIDVTITEKVKSTFIYFGWLFNYRTTLEGNVIRYIE